MTILPNSALPSRETRAASAFAEKARFWFQWGAATAVAMPVCIVLHELGHFSAAHSFGFPDVVLRYGSVDHRAAEAGLPSWQQGIQAAAGPVVTLLIVMTCCLAVLRVGCRAWAVAPAFAAGIRSLLIAPAYLLVRVRDGTVSGNFDENNAARHLEISTDLVVAVNVLVLAGAWAFLISRMAPGRRIVTLSAILVGAASGLAVYVGWLGPWLLP